MGFSYYPEAGVGSIWCVSRRFGVRFSPKTEGIAILLEIGDLFELLFLLSKDL